MIIFELQNDLKRTLGGGPLVSSCNRAALGFMDMQHELAIAMNALHDIAYVGSPSSHWLSGDNARARRALKELGNDNE